jgi:hypothetical protein
LQQELPGGEEPKSEIKTVEEKGVQEEHLANLLVELPIITKENLDSLFPDIINDDRYDRLVKQFAKEQPYYSQWLLTVTEAIPKDKAEAIIRSAVATYNITKLQIKKSGLSNPE